MNYDGTDTLSFNITNTSTTPLTSSITSFAFNVPDEVAGVIPFSGPTGWSFIPPLFCPDTIDTDSVNTPGNYGFFDIAGISSPDTSESFNGGTVALGIPQGSTFSFDFTFCGPDLATLDTGSFFLFSAPKNQNTNTQPLIVRFQGIDLGGGEDESDVALVPIPSVMLLFGSGLLGLAGIRR
ncbi:MAG: hypothetical protein JRJ73_03800, partial [Deltaproteobacteria bacterium]|nr:hypothetical protein [Deltaproteobacteria bacterium]